MKRFLFEIKFDGTNYHGWQIQKNAHSVQAQVNSSLEIILRQSIETVGCGRTDTGVHASKYYFHVDLTNPFPKDFLYRLNTILPEDISVVNYLEVSSDFNARFSAVKRKYQYFIHTKKNPFLNKYSWQNGNNLDLEKMNEAAKILCTFSNFKCFSKSNTQVDSFECKMYGAQWKSIGEDRIMFEIEANRFLRNMVRAIVGTMVDIGKHKLSIENFIQIIESQNRSNAGASVPGKGLFLCDVNY